MSTCSRAAPRRMFSACMGAALLLCSGAVGQALGAQPALDPAGAIPDFSSNKMTWVLMNGTAYFRAPGDTGPGPIVDMPGHEYVADYNTRVADTTNPILKPWAKKLMDINNDRVLAGGIPFYPTSRCWPGGVPGLLLYPGEPVFFIQTPKEVWILYQRDSQVRRIYLNVPHSKNPGFSAYGESVGHYENGDTLVVDTIGLDDKGPIDRFRTPHTEAIACRGALPAEQARKKYRDCLQRRGPRRVYRALESESGLRARTWSTIGGTVAGIHLRRWSPRLFCR